jgi:hypothetical protein
MISKERRVIESSTKTFFQDLNEQYQSFFLQVCQITRANKIL